ncbi:MAG: S8 family serine peptidase, partial [Hyphomonadaceae bacterium]
HLLVAAVGNDGPAAPALYPASYPGVVGVTGVDGRRALIEAARGTQVDFAAQGASLRAAAPGGRYSSVRGTSYASPIVAGMLARELPSPSLEGAARALERLRARAADLGERGADRTFGAGLISL